jgi:hypothetical protein
MDLNKPVKNKSVKNKSVKNKSVKDKSVKNKSVKNKSVKNKSVKNKSVKDKSVKDKSVKNKSVVNKSDENKKKYALDLICWRIQKCESRILWKNEWLNYIPDKSISWDLNINLNPLFPTNKYLDFKSPLEKLYKYYKVNYFKKLLQFLNETTFELKEDIIYINSDDYELNQILYYYLYNFKNILTLNIWPINKKLFNSDVNFKKLISLLKNNGKIHFIKKMEISKKEALPLFFQLYSDKKGMKNKNSILNKVIECGWSDSNTNINIKKDVMIIFYEPSNIKLLSGKDSKLKTDIRLLLTDINNKNVTKNNINIKSYLHVNDTFLQTIEIASIYLNKTNFDLFNTMNFDRFMSFIHFRGKIMFLMFKKLLYDNFETIDLFRILIFSSYILFLIGLRNPSDLDVIIYHKPEKAKTEKIENFIEYGASRGGYFGFIDLKYKGAGEWKEGGVDNRLDTWFMKEWPNLFGAEDYEDMIFNPRFHVNFLGLKVLSFEADLKRREKRGRSAAYANMIATKYYNIKNIDIPNIPENYYQEHVLHHYKTIAEKKVLYSKIRTMLKYRYNLQMTLSEIAEYLNENPNNYK